MQFLLIQQLNGHENSLKPVLRAFQAVDVPRCGFLGYEKFGDFCQKVNSAVTQDVVDVLWNLMDPGRSGRVTFSTCANALSIELARIVKSLEAKVC
jgi:Ca2+-binding EF-hand superfamily protein